MCVQSWAKTSQERCARKNKATTTFMEAKFGESKRSSGWLTPRQSKVDLQDFACDHWTLEYNKFAFMLLGGLSKRANEGLIDYFIVPRHDGGSDTPENSVGLCMLDNIGKKKKYAIVMPFISGFETALIRK